MDKPDIRTVIHLAPPASVEAYLQESGRASRDGAGAEAWLITTPEDARQIESEPAEPVDPGDGRPFSAEAVARARRLGMVRYAAGNSRCRREILLDALGIEARDCSGCDVCGGEARFRPPEEKPILELVRWNSGRFRKGQLARILIGRRNVEIRRRMLDITRGFGILPGWELEDAEEAIESLLRTGDLEFRRFGKGMIKAAD